jgi:hypothetical protein
MKAGTTTTTATTMITTIMNTALPPHMGTRTAMAIAIAMATMGTIMARCGTMRHSPSVWG